MYQPTFRFFFLLNLFIILSSGINVGCGGNQTHENSVLARTSINISDTFAILAAGKQYKKNAVHNFFYGKHYRELWTQPVKAQILDISKVEGGLVVKKRGGNMQTLSLKLENKQGKSYVLRTIDKDQSKALPHTLQKTFISNIFRDQASALNPYGALIVPTLAAAAGVLHTNPEFYVIPKDSSFHEFAKEFEGRMVILEEYPDETWKNNPTFQFASNIIPSEIFLKKRFEDPNISIDAREFAKARLFDIYINDWDRHIGQWRWAEFKKNGKEIYKPFPRDRDMAFYQYDDGLLPSLSLYINPKLQSFDYKYKNIGDMIKNGNYIDHLILPELTEEDFLQIADSIRKKITDKCIETAVKNLPEEAFKIIGKETIAKLKSRRNLLPFAAKEFYKALSKNIKLVGTDKEEKIVIKRLNNKETVITIYEKINLEVPVFQRIFNMKQTQEISIYALAGNDEIEIISEKFSGIPINIYSGYGNDILKDTKNSQSKEIKVVERKKDNNTISLGEKAKINYSENEEYLDFNRTGTRIK